MDIPAAQQDFPCQQGHDRSVREKGLKFAGHSETALAGRACANRGHGSSLELLGIVGNLSDRRSLKIEGCACHFCG